MFRIAIKARLFRLLLALVTTQVSLGLHVGHGDEGERSEMKDGAE